MGFSQKVIKQTSYQVMPPFDPKSLAYWDSKILVPPGPKLSFPPPSSWGEDAILEGIKNNACVYRAFFYIDIYYYDKHARIVLRI